MGDQEKSLPGATGSPKESPPITMVREGVVRCRGYRCLAVLWSDGLWRDLSGNPVEVVEVISELYDHSNPS